jgi:membrane fusion protein (multidrug efflux system)
MRCGLSLAVTLAALLGACGSKEEESVDLRTPPPVPKASMPGEPHEAPVPAAPKDRPPSPAAPAAPLVQVKVATPIRKTVPVTVDYTGQTVGSETVEIRARVEGFLQSVHFTEGTMVEKGDLLYEIDKEKMDQIVEQAEGALNVAKAEEEKALQDVNRNRPLIEKNAISREEYETSLSAAKAAHARVDAAAAAVERAKINRGYATVRAPVAGLIGKTEVDVGNLVGRGEATLLTTISQVDPIYAQVRIPENDMLQYQKLKAQGTKREDLDLSLYFSDGTRLPDRGKIAVVDRNIDEKTGTLLVQVSFPNPDRSVRPGQFARVQVVKETLKDALLVPQSAVEELQGSYRLYVVGDGDVVRVTPVKTGPRLGALWVISDGIGPDSRIVVEGRQKAKDGVPVKPVPVTIQDDGKLSAPEKSADEPPAGGSK